MGHKKIKRAKNYERVKPLQNNKAMVVAGWQFRVSQQTAEGGYGRYLNYTQRQSAAEPSADYSTSQTVKYNQFIDYTQRATATNYDNQNSNPTFTATQDFLGSTDEKRLRAQLDLAQKNGSPLWQGYISFSTQWLAEQSVYDVQTGRVNQAMIKTSIRDGMKRLLAQEKFGETVFWWGDIQFDTNHIHAHVGMSEVESSRVLRPDGERQARLQRKSMEGFKSVVTHSLISLSHQQNRASNQLLQEVISQRKTELVHGLNFEERKLKEIEQALPPNQKLWRASQASRSEMREVDQLTRRYLETMLKNLPEYQIWKDAVDQEAQDNKKLYGANSRDSADAKRRSLMDQLENKVWQEIKKQQPKKLTVESLTSEFNLIAQQTNRQHIDELKRQLMNTKLSDLQRKQLTQDLIVRKVALKKQRQRFMKSELTDKLQSWHQIDHSRLSVGDRYFLTQHEVRVAREIDRLARGKGRSLGQTDVYQVRVELVTAEMAVAVAKQTKNEVSWLARATSKGIIQAVYPDAKNRKVIREELAAKIRVINIKRQINLNQQKMRNQISEKSLFLKQNSQLYAELKKLNEKFGRTGEHGSRIKKEESKRAEQRRFLSVRQRQIIHSLIMQSSQRLLRLDRQTQFENEQIHRDHEQLQNEIEQEENDRRFGGI